MLSENSYYRIARDIEESGIEEHEKSLAKAREKVHKILKEKESSALEDKDIKVSWRIVKVWLHCKFGI